jgi:hypothetical protein
VAFNLPPPPAAEDIAAGPWRLWFFKLVQQLKQALDLSNVSGVLAIPNGGTGLSTTPGPNEILIGNGASYDLKTLLAGTNITFDETSNTITINSTASGGGSGKIYEPVAHQGELLFSINGDVLMAWGGDYAT